MKSEFDRLQRYPDCSFLVDRNVSDDHKEREAVKKDLLQLGVHPSVHVAEVFSSLGKVRFVYKFGLTPGSAFDLRTGWDLNDPAQRARMWPHLHQERPILIFGSWSGPGARTTHMRWIIDAYRWQVSQGRFCVHQHSGNLHLNVELCAMKSVLVSRVGWWRTFLTNCEEIHINLSMLNCSSHIAENCVLARIRGLRQALTRIGCLQALESGPTVEEPCRAEMTNNDHVYHDDVTGASLPSKMCEEAMQLEIKYMKEMDVYTPCEHEAVKEQGLTSIGTRWSSRTR